MVHPGEVADAIKLRRDFQVARDGIEIEKGRHYHGACLGGLVDERITVLVSPEGRDLTVPAYYNASRAQIELLAAVTWPDPCEVTDRLVAELWARRYGVLT